MAGDVARLAASGARVGRAVLVARRGSAPFLPGATLLVAEDGRLAGAISGGCAEAEAVAAMERVFRTGRAELAWLSAVEPDPLLPVSPCAGRLEVLLEPAVDADLLAVAAAHGGAVRAVVVEGAVVEGAVGDGMLVRADGTWSAVGPGGGAVAAVGAVVADIGAVVADIGAVAVGAEAAAGAVGAELVRASLAALRDGTSRCVDVAVAGGAWRVFLEVIPAVPRLVVVGAVGIAVPLLRAGRALGWRTVVVDPRAAFLDAVRGAEPDETHRAWPDVAIPKLALTAADAVCALSHDVKIDDPALAAAVRTSAGYVGAIGSRKTQALRRERMRAAGFTDAELARLRGPVGLDLGSRSPEAVALSILAEIEGMRGGGTGRPLTELRGG